MSAPAIEFRTPRAGDAEALLADMRPTDVAECDALLGPGRAAQAIAGGLEKSALAWTVEIDGEMCCIVGLVPFRMLGDRGAPWLLGTPMIDRHHRALIRQAPAYIARMLAVCPSLVNIVDARNTRSVAWLRRTGFTIHPPAPYGVAGLPFHLFTLEAPNV